MSRALRRHHEERIKKKYLFVAKRWAGRSFGGWKPPSFSKEEYLQRTVNKLAHHHKCPCWMCKNEKYDRNKVKRSGSSDG